MGAKLIPHMMAKVGANEPAGRPELMMIPFDGLPEPMNSDAIAVPDYIYDAARAPRESQGPAKLLISDRMESLLGWYV
jgi:hypothetical protein